MIKRSRRRVLVALFATATALFTTVAATPSAVVGAAPAVAAADEPAAVPAPRPSPATLDPSSVPVRNDAPDDALSGADGSGPVAPGRTDTAFSPQIVGGGAASQVPAASVALIVYNNGPSDSFSCSGTLVAARWVITAGHCVVQFSNNQPIRVANDPAHYTVYIGSNATGTAIAVDQVRLNDGYLLRTSSEDVPGYRKPDGSWVDGQANVANDTGLDDFGLLHLASASAAPPIPLAIDDSLGQSGTTVWAAGWGLTNPNSSNLPAALNEAAMTVANSTYCEITWHKYFSATSSTCYVSPTAATCNGDSGGPVMAKDEKNKWWLVAVISGGMSGCPVNSAYVGVRSSWAAPWVAAVTGQAQDGRAGESFNPMVPVRIVDSRTGDGVSFVPPSIYEPKTQGVFLPKPTLPANFVTRRPIYGTNGVPGIPVGGVAGVVLNVTVDQTGSGGGGFVAVYPCADGWNGTSSVNFQPGQTVANLVVSKVDRNGDVCFLAAAQTALIVDLAGWLGPQGADRATDSSDPIRIFDSRYPDAKLSNAATVGVQVTGAGRAPVGAKAAFLNVTSTSADANGFVTAWPCDSPRPLASNLNPVKGIDVPNSVVVQLDASGRVCLYSELSTHLVVDLDGWVTEGAPGTVKTVTPARLVDTRSNPRIGAFSPLIVHVAGLAGVPAGGLDSVLLNVTVTQPAGSGYLVVYPCGVVPVASNLNFVTDQTTPNAVLAKVDGSGNVCLLSAVPTHVLVDVAGYVRV